MARPREFDEDKVLTAAVDAFWAKGYEATSTRELTQSTGLTHSSIYAAYGDKRGIFLRSLDHYLDHTLRPRIHFLEASMPPRAAIASFFNEIVERSIADKQHRGCLLVNTALESTPEDPEIQQRVAEETVMIEAFFRRCLASAQEAGEIPPTPSPGEHARHLLAVLLGLRVLARVRPDEVVLRDVVRPPLTAIGIDWKPNP
ncbi:TetR/AcrR family transcriptional regulator [Rhizobium sp. P32RR-XVIII]|uniref:TetR/AcrR family transcriptional regulator n=1 Tax=Rhizobium sp. P32RR-XVIII TaxID=2726738 RepID=UPI0014567B4C|nr:TetR/AcrR family transcriptional regulator [Rhizobium sp. P32RR-XVIII]NLS08259.1 TetR/AcrR family transcriptional regulator [Rhizobium sp. P32RR-XVIII]